MLPITTSLNYKSKFYSSLYFYSGVIKRLEWRTSSVMSNLDIHHRSYPLSDVSASSLRYPRRCRNRQINSGDHNSTLKSISLYGVMFADNKIVRASLKATPANETNHPHGLIRNFNLGSTPRHYSLKWITRGQFVRFYWTLDRIYGVSRAHIYVHVCELTIVRECVLQDRKRDGKREKKRMECICESSTECCN